ncbi:unnamed protein product [Sphagnum balticum]
MFEKIISLLRQTSSSSQFCTQISTSFDDVKIVVDPNGPIELPISEQNAKALIRYAQPAKFGLGEKTLYDARVRNVWEIPADRINIDEIPWEHTLNSVLNQVQNDLSLSLDGRLTAHLHNLLIYEPGQFFMGHQDSEKIDGMLGTLVVLLPSVFEGGDLVVNQHGDQRIFTVPADLKSSLTFFAFYSDCVHEVKPVTSGYRVALTYNLVFESTAETIAARSNHDLTSGLSRYFFEPLRANSLANGERPPWLVYLLDHEYSQRGLSWNGLKGVDRLRAAELLGSAENLGLTIHLALVDIHQTWSTEFEESWGRYGRSRYRHDSDDDDDDEYESGGHRVTELINDEYELCSWVDRLGQQTELRSCGIPLELMCWTKSVDEYKPFRSEYEGYTGNAGNTLDRWYHRAAIVMWPTASEFASLGFVDMSSALKKIEKILSQNIVEGQSALKQILPHWKKIDPSYFIYAADKIPAVAVVKTAIAASEPELAAQLLSPMGIRSINTPASELLPLAQSYGEPWFLKQMQAWKNSQQDYHLVEVENLIQFVESFGKLFREIAIWIWEYQFSLVVSLDKESAKHCSSKAIKQELDKRMGRMWSLLCSAQMMDDTRLSNRAVDHILSHPILYHAVGLSALVRQSMKNQKQSPASWGVDRLLADTKARLMKQASIHRKSDDWSIGENIPCDCGDCQSLKVFLSASKQQKIVWPLAKDRRQHIHRIIDSMGISVSHTTQHTGSPHKLVLTKSPDLFKISLENAKSASEQLRLLEGG